MPGIARFLTLLIGPIVLIAGCYWVAAPANGSLTIPDPVWNSLPRSFRATAKSLLPDHPVFQGLEPDEDWQSRQTRIQQELQERCEFASHRLAEAWPELSIQCVSPLILVGEMSSGELQQLHSETILPTWRALCTTYFDGPPTAPITVFLFSKDETFRKWMRTLPKIPRAEYAGLYLRDQRTIALNLETGEGTLAHELTHALAHFDFPALPEWLDEGLASLHEECEFTDHGNELLGLDNWRRRPLMESLKAGRLKSLESLITDPFARSELGPLDYAQARYFCLFLQQKHLLAAYYRKCRTHGKFDSTGQGSLMELFPDQSLDEIDGQFHQWLLGLPEAIAARPKLSPL